MKAALLLLALLPALGAAEGRWSLRQVSGVLRQSDAVFRVPVMLPGPTLGWEERPLFAHDWDLGHVQTLRHDGGRDWGAWRGEWNLLAELYTSSDTTLLPGDPVREGRYDVLQRRHQGPGLLAGAEVDQLSLRWQGSSSALVLGRQSVNLGEAFYFSPLDLFAPFVPFEAYREFRAGVDALRATWSPSSFSLLEAVAVAEAQGRGSLLLRAQANGDAWSITGLGGRHRNDSFGGGALQLEFWGSSWGFEGAWRAPLALPSHLSEEHRFHWNWSHSRQWSPALSSRLEHRVDWDLQVHRSYGINFTVPRIQSGLSLQAQASPLWILSAAVFLVQQGRQAATLQLGAERSLSDDSVLGLRFGAPMRDNHDLSDQWQPYRAELELRTTL